MLVTLQVCILKFKVKLVQSFFTFSIFFHFSADLAIKTIDPFQDRHGSP